MQDLQIEPTKQTPLINFFSSGKLILAGSVYPENAKEFFAPVIDWVVQSELNEVDFDLIIEYINTAAAKKLVDLLLKMQANKHITKIQVNWYYQKWDEDGLETGQILESSLPKIQFNYVEYEKNS